MEFQVFEASDAFDQIEKHRSECEDCQNATSIRTACPEIQALHDDIVRKSRDNFQNGNVQKVRKL